MRGELRAYLFRNKYKKKERKNIYIFKEKKKERKINLCYSKSRNQYDLEKLNRL